MHEIFTENLKNLTNHDMLAPCLKAKRKMQNSAGQKVSITCSIMRSKQGPKFAVSLQTADESLGDVFSDSAQGVMQKVYSKLGLSTTGKVNLVVVTLVHLHF